MTFHARGLSPEEAARPSGTRPTAIDRPPDDRRKAVRALTGQAFLPSRHGGRQGNGQRGRVYDGFGHLTVGQWPLFWSASRGSLSAPRGSAATSATGLTRRSTPRSRRGLCSCPTSVTVAHEDAGTAAGASRATASRARRRRRCRQVTSSARPSRRARAAASNPHGPFGPADFKCFTGNGNILNL